jgi:hypothetical protein
MSINTQSLYDAKGIKFGVSAGSDTYNTLFMEALIKTLTDLENYTGMDITIPEDVATDIAIDAKYYSAVSAGIDFYLQDSNMFTANPIPQAEERFIRQMRQAQRMYLSGIDLGVRFGTLEAGVSSSLVSEGY